MVCESCGYRNASDALTCNLCGTLLKRAKEEGRHAQDSEKRKKDLEKATDTWLDSHTEVVEIPPEEEKEKDVITKAIKKAYGAEPEKKNFCLLCFPFDPVPVVPALSIVIGRTRSADLFLPLGLVSREHARIIPSGQSFEVRDLGSSNGTRVNGEKIHHKILEPGDVIQIGPYDIKFRAYTGSIADLRAAEDDTEHSKTLMSLDDGSDATTFAGKVGEMKIDEVIQLIEFNRKTGTLLILAEKDAGKLFFRDGQILHAEFADAVDVKAVQRVISLKAGNFSFQMGLPMCDQTMYEPTSKVLLDALRVMDEEEK